MSGAARARCWASGRGGGARGRGELTVLTNPNAAYVSAGQFGEVLAEEFVTRTGTRVEGTRPIDRLNALTRAGVLVGWSRAAFGTLRRGRNDAAHHYLFDTTKAPEALKLCWQLGDLFDRAMGGTRAVTAFVPPTLPAETPRPIRRRSRSCARRRTITGARRPSPA